MIDHLGKYEQKLTYHTRSSSSGNQLMERRSKNSNHKLKRITEAAEEELSNKLDSLARNGGVVELSNRARFVRAE